MAPASPTERGMAHTARSILHAACCVLHGPPHLNGVALESGEAGDVHVAAVRYAQDTTM